MSWWYDSLDVGLQGDVRPLQLLGAALAMGYMYQGPPFRSGRGCFCLYHPTMIDT